MGRYVEFEIWQKGNVRHLMTSKDETDCPECEGQGESDCIHCGHGAWCERCGGGGIIQGIDLSESEAMAISTYRDYRKELIRDFAQVSNYTLTPMFDEACLALSIANH